MPGKLPGYSYNTWDALTNHPETFQQEIDQLGWTARELVTFYEAGYTVKDLLRHLELMDTLITISDASPADRKSLHQMIGRIRYLTIHQRKFSEGAK